MYGRKIVCLVWSGDKANPLQKLATDDKSRCYKKVAKVEYGGPGRFFRDTGILVKNLEIQDIFVNIERDTGYLDQF